MTKGIDYGRGVTNIDLNKIRFGVINQKEVMQAWCDSSEAVYPELEESEEENYDCIEPLFFEYKEEGYKCEASEDGDIFITKSPFYTYAQFCSPCAPGACYLMSSIEEKDNNNKCYCFGHDWFDSGKAPYKVYDIKTNFSTK